MAGTGAQRRKAAPRRLLLDPYQMLHLGDHAAHRGRVLEGAGAMTLVEAEPLQGRLLIGLAADRAADLRHRHGLLRLRHDDYSRASFSPSRRPRISLTFLPRRAATERGLTRLLSASKVALIMLWGLEVPTDFATTSLTPSASKIAR